LGIRPVVKEVLDPLGGDIAVLAPRAGIADAAAGMANATTTPARTRVPTSVLARDRAALSSSVRAVHPRMPCARHVMLLLHSSSSSRSR
jgi:hypothetical protein